MPSTVSMIDHRELLSSAEAVDALPVSVSRLTTLVAAGDPDVRDIVEVISLDQALTANLLRRANSASLGGRAQITTVRDATVRLGTTAVVSMALASSVSRRMHRALPAYRLAEGELWSHSVAASIAADLIRVRSSATVPVESATAALLHDFGKIVLSRHFGPRVLELLDHAAEVDRMNLLEAETAVLGVNHADIGALVAQQWKLPYSIVDAILHHHSTDPDLMPMNGAVSLAHAMVPDMLRSPDALPTDDRVPVFESHLGVMLKLGLDPSAYPELLMTARGKYGAVADRYGAGHP